MTPLLKKKYRAMAKLGRMSGFNNHETLGRLSQYVDIADSQELRNIVDEVYNIPQKEIDKKLNEILKDTK
jgi:hypothetical protein